MTLARAVDSLQRSLSLAWKLSQPAAAGHLLRQLIGQNRSQKLGDCALPGVPDAIATAIYQLWIQRFERSGNRHFEGRRLRPRSNRARPGITILLPALAADPSDLHGSIESIRRQEASGWQVSILAGNELASSGAVRTLADSDRRFRILECSETTQVPINTVADTDWLAWLEPGDRLAEGAVVETSSVLRERPIVQLVYSDEDRIDARGRRFAPRFKPDWNPELQQATDYIGDLVVCRREAVEAAGTSVTPTTRDAWRDALHRTLPTLAPDALSHVSRILYHRRATISPAARLAAPRPSIPEPAPSISLIIPTRNCHALLRRCLDTLFEYTDYPDIDVLVVDNDSDDPESVEYLDNLASSPRITVLRHAGVFNYSAINNFAVAHSRSRLIGLLNNDLEFIHRGWLREMIGLALKADVGAVGAKLLYPDLTVQHGGVLLGGGSARDPVAGHLFHGLPREHPGYCGRACSVQEVSAVTAACMILRREVFEQVGGFDAEHLPVAFNDVDLCLRIRDQGFRILWTPHAEVVHIESASRGSDLVPGSRSRFAGEVDMMRRRWGAVLDHDPFYNPNLDPTRCDFALAFPPRLPL